MTAKPETPSDFIDDELVCYIARRHNMRPCELVRQIQNGSAPENLPLEDNEVAILNDMGLKQSAKGRNKPNT